MKNVKFVSAPLNRANFVIHLSILMTMCARNFLLNIWQKGRGHAVELWNLFFMRLLKLGKTTRNHLILRLMSDIVPFLWWTPKNIWKTFRIAKYSILFAIPGRLMPIPRKERYRFQSSTT